MEAAASASTKGNPFSAEDEVKHLQREVALLKNQLAAAKGQNDDVCQQNDRLRSKVSELEAQLLVASPKPPFVTEQGNCSGSIAEPDHEASDHQLVIICRQNPPLSSTDLADIRKLLAADPRAANVTGQSTYVARCGLMHAFLIF
jgi:hypothetical protein